MGKKGCSVLHLNLHGTNRKTKTNERYFRRDSISHCLHLGLLELAFSLHGMSVCTVDSIYLRLLLGTLHSLNFTSDCAGGCTWTLYLRTIPMSLLLKTTPMNFTREGIQWTLLGNNSNELYISEKKTLPENPFLRLLKMILGSRPVNLVWNHFPQTFGQSYLTETVFFLDSTRHLNLHEMPHLIIKCIQLVILSTCFFWNSMSLLVKNIRTILYKVACDFHS